MITCADVREFILTASPEELRALQSPEARSHVEACRECRAALQAVLTGTSTLGDALATLCAGEVIPATPALRPAAHTRVRARRYLAAAATLACVVAGSIMLRNAQSRRSVEQPFQLPPRLVIERPVVNAGGASAVAVMQPTNPRITIVWYLPTRGKL